MSDQQLLAVNLGFSALMVVVFPTLSLAYRTGWWLSSRVGTGLEWYARLSPGFYAFTVMAFSYAALGALLFVDLTLGIEMPKWLGLTFVIIMTLSLAIGWKEAISPSRWRNLPEWWEKAFVVHDN